MKQHRTQRFALRRKLLSNGIGELVNVLLFFALFFWLRSTYGSALFGNFTILGLLTLDIVLLLGGLYWLGKRWHLWRPLPLSTWMRLLQAIYLLMSVLMLPFPIFLIIALLQHHIGTQGDLILGICLYLFAGGEFIHYFFFKITMSARERQLVFRQRRLLPARLWREKQRAQRELSKATVVNNTQKDYDYKN